MTTTLPYDLIRRRGLMLVLSSPSGAGKTTISRRLLENDKEISFSISATTRKPRTGEVDGVHYHFVDTTDFNLLVNRDQFLEYANVFGNYYGTPRIPVENALAQGKDVLFDIDVQGTKQLAEKAREDLVSIFILPPSWQELERRLYGRGLDDPAVINRRLATAIDEMACWAEYDYVIINKDLDQSVEAVRSILLAERLKRRRQVGLSEFISGLQAGQ